MKTFTTELELLAAKAYREVVLPLFLERAPELALQGLKNLREEAGRRAFWDVEGCVDIEWSEEGHRDALLELVREHTPMDVRVDFDEAREKIVFAPGLYRAGELNGKKEYDFPCWQKRWGGLVHNMPHLKERGITGDNVAVFEAILKQFGCLDGEVMETASMPGDFNSTLGVEILDQVLTWAMRDSSTPKNMNMGELRKLYACMAAGADNVNQLKSVEDAYKELFSTK